MEESSEDQSLEMPGQELIQFCENLDLPHDVVERVTMMLDCAEDADLFSPELKVSRSEILSCLVFVASVEIRMPYGPNDPHCAIDNLSSPSISLTKLLLAAQINIKSFFNTMKTLRDRLSISDSVMEYLTCIERNYCVVAALHHTFQTRMCPQIFRDEKSCDDIVLFSREYSLPPIPETEGVSFRKKQTWVLFLLSKHHLLKDSKELYFNFQLLVCCLEFVLRHTPSFLLNSPYDASRYESLHTNDQEESALLRHLASDFDLVLPEVKDLYNKFASSFFHELMSSHGSLDLDDLIGEYCDIYEREGEINEMMFLDKDWHLLPLEITSGVMESSSLPSEVAHKKEVVPPGLMTPTKAAVTTVQQMMALVKDVGAEPTPQLLEIFKLCKPDPSEEIKRHVFALEELFSAKFCAKHNICDSHIAKKRYCLGIRLFFKVLEAMLKKEGTILPPNVLGILLHKKEFITSMIACSIEVVLTTFGQSWNQASCSMTSEATACTFPWILEAFSLQAYEFYKVIESFIKAESLPIDIMKHLQSIEHHILESLVWKEGSVVYEVMGKKNWEVESMITPTSSPTKAQDSSKGQGTSKSAVQLFLSPVKQAYSRESTPTKLDPTVSNPLPFAKYTSEEPQQNKDDLEKHLFSELSKASKQKSQSLSHFLSRVCRLGYFRLCKLCTWLNIGKDVQHKIWTCFEHCMTQMTSIIKDRHIDQILMCCIFGMSKVVRQDVSFKSIVHEYKNMQHAKPEVHKHVFINKDKTDSIIYFYNHVFLDSIKSYILQFSPQRPAIPQLSPLPKQAQASPRNLLVKKNFMVSPMKSTEFKAPASPSHMTPHTRLLYSFGDSIGSSEKLKHINAAMSLRGPSSAKKRLNMDDLSVSAPAAKSSKSLQF